MNRNPLLNFFPVTNTIKSIRLNQKEALDKLWECLERGDTKITVCAPTGSGKSILGITLFKYFGSLDKKCLYTSPLNNLVDQIEGYDFQDIYTLKGRVHYRCLAKNDTSDKGFCQRDRCPSSKRVRSCKHEPYGACKTCVCRHCIYKIAFLKFKNSVKGNTNFTLFLMGVDNSPDVIVIDEVDLMESFIRNHYSFTADGTFDSNFSVAVEQLKEYQKGLQSELDELLKTVNDVTVSKDIANGVR